MTCLPYVLAVFACSLILCDAVSKGNSQSLKFVTGKQGKVKDVPLSEFLWESTAMYREEALRSIYVQGIAKANLNPEQFGAYNLQDSIYCYRATQGFDIAAKNTTDASLKAFLDGRVASYGKYTDELFKTWHIQDPNGITLDKAASDYINHEHNVAMTYDSVYYVVSIIPCTKLWPWIGQQIGVSNTSNFGVYTDWAWENFNPDDSGVAKYETVINEAYEQGNIDRNTALDIYAGSMRGEANFFNSV